MVYIDHTHTVYFLVCLNVFPTKEKLLNLVLFTLETPTPSDSEKRQKTQRLTSLSDTQKQELANMTKASDMEPEERKRQYSALRRAIYKDAPAALVAKFSLANDSERSLKIELSTALGYIVG